MTLAMSHGGCNLILRMGNQTLVMCPKEARHLAKVLRRMANQGDECRAGSKEGDK